MELRDLSLTGDRGPTPAGGDRNGVVRWLARRDPGFWALRRAGRAAIIMPGLFALGTLVLDSATLAIFAAFGSMALLLMVDFSGSRRDRLEATVALALAGGVLISLATLVSQVWWLAATVTAGVVFVVLFSGVISSVLASASTALIIAFVLPVTMPGSVADLPDRLAGWSLASAAAVVAVTVLWPAATREPLRVYTVECCETLAARLRAEARGGAGESWDENERDAAVVTAEHAMEKLRAAFYSTVPRPTGLGTASRTLIRLVDELGSLTATVKQATVRQRASGTSAEVLAVELRCAQVLSCGAHLLRQPTRRRSSVDVAPLRAARADVHQSLTELALSVTRHLPDVLVDSADGTAKTVDSREPAFHAQRTTFAVDAVALSIERTVQAENRSFSARLLGRQPDGIQGPFVAARERALAHLNPRSVWLHNSVRGAVGLALAVLATRVPGVQHSFWVVLGALSVLRSNALSTGQHILRALSGTTVGIVLGGAIVALIGANPTLLWALLPVSILVAGLAPAAISFAAGQAGFTVALVILFNIIEPIGYRVGLIRIEDIVIGSTVSLVVGLLFWPRGATLALRGALADAYGAGGRYLSSVVGYGVGRCFTSHQAPVRPEAAAVEAARASHRLDDAFRQYLAERGGGGVKLPDTTALISGAVAVRLTGDAVLDLWDREPGTFDGDRTAAGAELTSVAGRISSWYEDFGGALAGGHPLPTPLERDQAAEGVLIAAVCADLADRQGTGTPTAVRMIWTGDHLDATRRRQSTLSGPARELARWAGR